MRFNGNRSTVDVLTTLDALGRAVLTQRQQRPGSANWDSVSTTFDAMDRPSSDALLAAHVAFAGGGKA